MKRITEKKVGKKSVFTIDTVIANEVFDTQEISIQVDTVEVQT